jgi:hypothetical protein
VTDKVKKAVFEALLDREGYDIMDVVHEPGTGRVRFKMEGEADGEIVINEFEVKVEQIGVEHVDPPSEEWDFIPLGFTCRGCKKKFTGREQCRNTGMCPNCSDNYEPVKPSDLRGPF